MLKGVLILFLLTLASPLLAQGQASYWYFGEKAGLNFGTGSPSTLDFVPPLKTSYHDITSSASDVEGNLLFATDGDKVYNRSGEIMENGDLYPNGGATYNTVVVPKPGHRGIYYIVTVTQMGPPIFLHYAEVDMNGGAGSGRVVSRQGELMRSAAFRVAAVRHCNGEDYWIMGQEANTNRFYAFLVTEQGICSKPVVSRAGQAQALQYYGDMKFSPDGTRLVSVAKDQDSQLFWFNQRTGQVTFQQRIPKDLFGSAENYTSDYHSASFSPDSKSLYVSSGFWRALDGRCAKLVQYDLEATDIIKSHHVIYDNSKDGSDRGPNSECRSEGVGDIQIGPDGKLYISNHGRKYLHVITNPNEKRQRLDFQLNGADVGSGVSSWRLPNFVESLFRGLGTETSCPQSSGEVSFVYENTCFSQNTSFQADLKDNGPYSVSWDFGDPKSAGNTSIELNPLHVYSAPGTYEVSLTLFSLKDCRPVKTVTRTVTILPATPVDLGPDRVLCGNEEIVLDATSPAALSYRWSDGSTGATLKVREPGKYWVEVDQGGCKLRDEVRLGKAEEITASIGRDTVLCVGQRLTLDATSPGASYEWSNGNRDPKLEVYASGVYEVTIRNACFESKQSVRVTVLDCEDLTHGYVRCREVNESSVPNIFTPNNDGKNDSFGLQGAAEMKGYALQVFDRWGKRVFRSSESVLDWNGEGAPGGVYFYVIRFDCGEERKVVSRVVKGSLTLMR
ncbi:T9SS type B sorting domain-containing protein [Pontibacter ummariensis]|nr:gliding motility-associated C-terminal domain-containing protein [Pontibacter ummariensis]